MERIASQQFIGYLMKNKLLAEFQSAYKQFYRTETVMGRVLNDVLWAIGTHSEAALVLLDMLSAFDTIDHTLLTDRQERSYGVGGTALFWFRSYLTERSQEYYVHFQDTPVWSASGLSTGSTFILPVILRID